MLLVLFHLVQVRITTGAYAVGAYRRKIVCGPRSMETTMSMGLAMTLQRSGLQCQPAHPKPSQLLLPITPQCGAVTLREFRISHSLFRICNTSLNAGSKDDQVPSRAELGMPHSMLRCGVLLHDAAETSKICQGPCEVRPGTTVLEAFAACYSALEVKASIRAQALLQRRVRRMRSNQFSIKERNDECGVPKMIWHARLAWWSNGLPSPAQQWLG